MPHWYWEKKELRATPSQAPTSSTSAPMGGVTGGSGAPTAASSSNGPPKIDFDTEMRYRREGARFIIELGKALNLSHNTMASGAVYFHRFYMFHSFVDFPKYVVATCCLFLAGKAEETPKKCRDFIRTLRSLTNDDQFGTFGPDPREEIMVIERVLLQTIKFDLQVDHPYSSLIKYAKCLKGDKAKLQRMVQMSWTFVNDSLCTTLCLQWEPEIIAIALMYLAAKLSKFEVKDWNNRQDWHRHWWDQYVEDLDVDILEDICHQVLDLYAQPHMPAKDQVESPPPGQQRPASTQPGTASSSGGAVASDKPRSGSTTPCSSGAATKKTTPPPPREQPPPPPQSKSRPQTPPIPPAGPPLPPSASAPNAVAGAPGPSVAPASAPFQPFSSVPPPPPPSAAVGPVPAAAPFPPPQNYAPPAPFVANAFGTAPPPPPSAPAAPPNGGAPPAAPGGSFNYPPPANAPSGSYYNQPPPPPPPPPPGGSTGGGYHRSHRF